jgi:hypothetical protein
MVYIISFLILFIIIQFSQEFFINQLSSLVRFNLWNVNLFFAISSVVICIHFLVFSLIENLKPQLGFIYLPTIFIKGILFFFTFRVTIFNLSALTTTERLNLLIPLLLFLGLEVYFVVKVIRNTEV